MRLRTIAIIGSFLALAILWTLRQPTSSTAQNASSQAGIKNSARDVSGTKKPPPDQLTGRRRVVEEVIGALATPITFHGRVIDQNGDPVPDATVNYTALDKFDAPGSKYDGKSDTDGRFALDGVAGAVLSVGVRKEGYYMIDGKSANTFAYGIGSDSTRQEPPTKDDPAIFILQKMGATEPLIRISTGGIKVPRDGTPVNVDLLTGRKGVASSTDSIRVEAWTEKQSLNPEARYNWRCRLSVPGGGLLECKEQFDFEAPASGYRVADETLAVATDAPWKQRFTKIFFAQLPSGRYARLKFMFTSGGDHFFTLESYLNPTPGSRNLEFDPKKALKPLKATGALGGR